MVMQTFNTKPTGASTNEWLTPRWLLNKLGSLELDPCAAKGRPWDCATAFKVNDKNLECLRVYRTHTLDKKERNELTITFTDTEGGVA